MNGEDITLEYGEGKSWVIESGASDAYWDVYADINMVMEGWSFFTNYANWLMLGCRSGDSFSRRSGFIFYIRFCTFTSRQ